MIYLPNPKHKHSTGGSVQGGAKQRGGAGRAGEGPYADRTVGQGSNCLLCPDRKIEKRT